MFVMLTGMFPFSGINERDLFSKVGTGAFKIPDTLGFEAKRLINKILVVDPSKRIKAGELCTDAWIKASR